MHVTGSMAWLFYDSLVFLAHRRGPIIEADFEQYLVAIRAHTEVTSAVIRAGDAAPSARQRGELIRWFEHRPRRAAVITDSLIARGGVTAMSWFGAPIRAFAPDELSAAMSFAGVEAVGVEEATRVFEELMAMVRAPQRARASRDERAHRHAP